MIGRLAIAAALVVIVAACGGGAAATDDYIDAHNAFVDVIRSSSSALSETATLAERTAATTRVSKAAGDFADALKAIDFGSSQETADELVRAVLVMEQRAKVASDAPDAATALILEAAMVEPMQEIADLSAVLADALGAELR